MPPSDEQKRQLREIAALPMPDGTDGPPPSFTSQEPFNPGTGGQRDWMIESSGKAAEPDKFDPNNPGGKEEDKSEEILSTLVLIHEALVGIREDLIELPTRITEELTNS